MDRYNDGREGGGSEATGEPTSVHLEVQAGASPAENDPWLTSLRRMLEASGAPPSVEEAARSMGMSVRTLQRYLRSIGTNFRKETRAARAAAAPKGSKRSGRPGTALLLVDTRPLTPNPSPWGEGCLFATPSLRAVLFPPQMGRG